MKNNQKEIDMVVGEIRNKIKKIENSIIDSKTITTAKSIDGRYGIDENVFIINQGRFQIAMLELREYLGKELSKLHKDEKVIAEGKIKKVFGWLPKKELRIWFSEIERINSKIINKGKNIILIARVVKNENN